MNWWGDDNCKYCGYKKWSERCGAMSKQGMQCDCLLYTSDAADDSLRVDLGGRRIIKKKIF